ncbi:MAG: TraM recognition domain-containing protein [Deltaproteobacteria bacterium]|nr:TraM recognition domain-containing protein [Deltaproteobacteria bacterium]
MLPAILLFRIGKRIGEDEDEQGEPSLFARLWRRARPVEHSPGLVQLGWLKNGRDLVSMGAERTMHTHVVGATGSGKTEALKRIIEDDIASGFGVIWIDGKGAEENAAWFAAMAQKYDRNNALRMFMPSRKLGSYNPLKNGDATELKDRLVSSFEWSEQYYKGRAQVVLQAALRSLLSQQDRSFTMDDLAVALEPSRDGFAHLLARSTDAMANELLAAYAKDKEWQQAVSKARDDLALFVTSSYGEMLTGAAHQLDFWDVYDQRQLAYVQVPVGLSSEFMRCLGKLMLADLNSLNSAIATGLMQKRDGLCSVVIDEFGNFVTPQFITLLREARSQNFALTIAHQSLGDLRALTPEAADQIQGNTNTKIILQQTAHEDADNWAKLIGTRHAFEQTFQTEQGLLGDSLSGRGSLRETHQFVIEPDEIKNLKQGRAVFLRKHPAPFVGVVDIMQATPYEMSRNADGETIIDVCANELPKRDAADDNVPMWNLRGVKRAELAAAKTTTPAESRPKEKARRKAAAPEPQPSSEPDAPHASNEDEPEHSPRPKRAAGVTHGGEW